MNELSTLPALLALAEERARAHHEALNARKVRLGYVNKSWSQIHETWGTLLRNVELDLLCDLTRPDSRDAVARLVVVAMGGKADDGAILHRSHRGYYELWALWPDERGNFGFRSISFIPWADIKEVDPRFSPMWVKPAPYLSDGTIENNAITDPAEALRRIALATLSEAP